MKRIISIIMLLIFSVFLFGFQSNDTLILKGNNTNKVLVSANPLAKVVTFDYTTANQLLSMSARTYTIDTIISITNSEILTLLKGCVNKSPPQKLLNSIKIHKQIYTICYTFSFGMILILIVTIFFGSEQMNWDSYLKIMSIQSILILFFALLAPILIDHLFNTDYFSYILEWSG